MDNKFQYGFFDDSRKECFNKFGGIFDLPVIDNPYIVALSYLEDGNILDIGAGKDQPFKSVIDPSAPNRYYSLDNDPMGIFDFNHIQDIPDTLKFSFILANQFFEHLILEDSIDFILKLKSFIELKGTFICTIPNIQHPNRYWGDVTHKTHWNYNNIYMLYKYAGLDVIKIARYSKRHPQGIIEKTLAKYISRIYRMDWCDSIIMIGQKNV